MRLLPRSMAGRMIAVLVLALVAAQLLSLLVLISERDRAVRDTRQDRLAARISDTVRFLEAAPPKLHGRYLEAVSVHWLQYRLEEQPAVAKPGDCKRPLRQRLARLLGGSEKRFRVGEVMPGLRETYHEGTDPGKGPPHKPAFAVSIPRPGGQWLNVVMLRYRGWEWLGGPLLSLGLSALTLSMAVILLVRRTTRPLARLAAAAERFGRGERPGPVAEEGPEDTRRAIRAFNAMQERLDRFVRDRTRMLAAISHDLRTPITSLRLRAELLEEGEAKERMVATLDELQRMTEAALAFARQEEREEPTQPVDLGALLDSLCQDLGDLDMPVECADPPRLVYPCRTTALKRAVRNLVENAVAYGRRARVGLASEDGGARITVDDDGPGIAEANTEWVFDPFVRLEESRNPETGGIGLGLAIARDIVRAHGGDIFLTNRPEGGLRATVRLPSAPSSPE